jgi:lysophospholipase L1-like esterase
VTPVWRSYVALGDSFTEGLQDFDPDGRPRGWADLLAQHLADRGSADVRYANLAVRGRLLGPILAEQLDPALALRPDLVSLVGGGNDLLRPDANPDALAGALERAVVRLREAGIDVLLGTGIDPADSPVIRLTRNRVAILDAHIFSIAQRHGAHVVNLWGMRSIRDWRMWHADRIHLNTEGHERVAQAALVGRGLGADRPDWDEPLPAATPLTRREALDWNLAWGREHLGPWLGRRVRRTSSGADRAPKQPEYRVVCPVR